MQRFLLPVVRFTALLGLLFFTTVNSANATDSDREPSLLVVGDSISAAYGMSLQQGWVNHLQQQLSTQLPHLNVINASISGDTTAGALRRLPALLKQHRPTVVVLELGGNDGLRGFPIASFRKNLTALVETAQKSGAKVVLLPMEIPPNYGRRYTRDFRDSYPQIAQATNSVLAPFILDGIATEPALMQADGIHPKAEAQQQMMNTVLPAIEEALND